MTAVKASSGRRDEEYKNFVNLCLKTIVPFLLIFTSHSSDHCLTQSSFLPFNSFTSKASPFHSTLSLFCLPVRLHLVLQKHTSVNMYFSNIIVSALAAQAFSRDGQVPSAGKFAVCFSLQSLNFATNLLQALMVAGAIPGSALPVFTTLETREVRFDSMHQ